MRLVFRQEASADMRRIASETKAAWGDAQAAVYSDNLRNSIKSLLEFPLRYSEVLERQPLRRLNAGRHAVFYLVGEDQVEIVRVLHVARDFTMLL